MGVNGGVHGSLYKYIYIYIYSPNRFICRGSNGIGQGALIALPLRGGCRGADIVVNINTNAMVPSNTQGKIKVSGNFWHDIYQLLAKMTLSPAGKPLLLDDFQMIPKCPPNAPQMTPK